MHRQIINACMVIMNNKNTHFDLNNTGIVRDLNSHLTLS